MKNPTIVLADYAYGIAAFMGGVAFIVIGRRIKEISTKQQLPEADISFRTPTVCYGSVVRVYQTRKQTSVVPTRFKPREVP